MNVYIRFLIKVYIKLTCCCFNAERNFIAWKKILTSLNVTKSAVGTAFSVQMWAKLQFWAPKVHSPAVSEAAKAFQRVLVMQNVSLMYIFGSSGFTTKTEIFRILTSKFSPFCTFFVDFGPIFTILSTFQAQVLQKKVAGGSWTVGGCFPIPLTPPGPTIPKSIICTGKIRSLPGLHLLTMHMLTLMNAIMPLQQNSCQECYAVDFLAS